MPVSTLRSSVKPGPATRAILGPAGNRVRVVEEEERKQNQKPKDHESLKKKAKNVKKKMVNDDEKAKAHEAKAKLSSADSSCDGGVVNGGDGGNGGGERLRKVKKKVNKAAKIVPDGVESLSSVAPVEGVVVPTKRCDWITPNSEPLYVQFHDEEWGVPVRDDKKLFELLILSQALGELTWSTILSRRNTFRIMFEDFDPSLVAKFDEKMLSLMENENTLLSELKLRAIVENAKQFLKIQQEFGSFSSYCWRFVNNKQVKCGFRYTRQVPAKTPKSELISKDLMRRGFRCVGPTVVYSFMQVAGLANDHLSTCFRFNQCDRCVEREPTQELVKTSIQEEDAANTRTSNES